MVGRTVTALALWLLAAAAAAEVTLQTRGTRLDLRASAAPLSEVLDRLARQTGMKVDYGGSVPRQPVTLTLVDRSPLEVVLALLEGQGLNFALVSDEIDGRVRTLILAGRTSTSSSTAQAQRPAPRPTFRPQAPTEPDVFEPEPDMPDIGDDQGAQPGPPPDAPNPAALRPQPGPGERPAEADPAAPAPPVQQWPVSPFTPQPPAPQPGPQPLPGQTMPGSPQPGPGATTPR
jgi:hypothetical protein